MHIERALQALLVRWPARLTLPVLLLSLCAAMLLTQFHLRSEQARSHARLELTQTLAELANQTARRLEAMAELDGLGARRGMVTRLGLYPAVREAWLLDAEGRTLAGLRRAEQGRGLLDIGLRLSPAEAKLLAASEALPGEDAASLREDVLRLQVEPVLIRSDPPQYGRLLVLGDSRPGEAEALETLRRVFRGEALVVVLGAVVLWWLLRLQLLDRGARLQRTAQALYQSGSAPHTDVAGNDELGQIGRAMDAGLDRLKRHEAVQRLALEGTRALQAFDTAQARLLWLAERLIESGGFVAVRVRAHGSEGAVLIERHAAQLAAVPECVPARRYALAAEPGHAAAPACLEV